MLGAISAIATLFFTCVLFAPQALFYANKAGDASAITTFYTTIFGHVHPMTLSHSLLSYQDCTEAMDQALADDKGGRVRFADQASALHFRARCHQARMLTRNQNKRIYEDPAHPQHGACTYDELVLRLRHSEPYWYIYLERMTAENIEVEPLSEVQALPKPEPVLRLAAPAVRPEPQPFTDGMKRRL